jgi:lysozyme family protein
MNFDAAFDKLIQFEGGYVNRSDDPGGATNYGITQATARSHGYTGDMRDLPVGTAKAIYKTDYWDAVRVDTLPDALKYAAFDTAVNNGVTRANQWLLAAMRDDAEPYQVLCRFMGLRLQFYTSLTIWPTFGKGWTRRCATILATA